MLLHTPFYCEENVYNALAADPALTHAVFISNTAQSVLLFRQNNKAYVIWDYHVIALQLSHGLVWDYDSSLGTPCDFSHYIDNTFKSPLVASIPSELLPRFRVIPRETFLAHFSSDRSHMLAEGQYIHPPPQYTCIKGDKAVHPHHLFHDYVDMTIPQRNGFEFGTVMEAEQFFQLATTQPVPQISSSSIPEAP